MARRDELAVVYQCNVRTVVLHRCPLKVEIEGVLCTTPSTGHLTPYDNYALSTNNTGQPSVSVHNSRSNRDWANGEHLRRCLHQLHPIAGDACLEPLGPASNVVPEQDGIRVRYAGGTTMPQLYLDG
jgi:hypothetical protein